MSSKIKVDSIETVSGSGTISIPTGNNLSVAGTSSFTAATFGEIRPNNIASTSGTNAMTIASGGQVTFPQTATFTTSPTGAGSLIKLLDTTVSSVGGNYDINNTYI